MGHKLSSNIRCPNLTEDATKSVEKSLITKKCAQCKTLHNLKKLNYQIIKILENFFQNVNWFSWINLISVLSISNIDITIRHASNFPVSLVISVKFLLAQLKPLFNTTLIMLFMGFPTLSYPTWPRMTRCKAKPNVKITQSNLSQLVYKSW